MQTLILLIRLNFGVEGSGSHCSEYHICSVEEKVLYGRGAMKSHNKLNKFLVNIYLAIISETEDSLKNGPKSKKKKSVIYIQFDKLNHKL